MTQSMCLSMEEKIYGVILETALEDSISLPYQALSREKINKKTLEFFQQEIPLPSVQNF